MGLNLNKVVAVTVFSLMLNGSGCLFSSAFASSESVSKIELSHLRKQSLMTALHERIARHQQMSLDDIKKEFLFDLDQNRQFIQRKGLFTPEVDEKFIQAEKQFKEIESKEEWVSLEAESEKSLVSSINVIFGITRALDAATSEDGDEDGFRTIVLSQLLTIPLDIILLPWAMLISFATWL